MTLRVVKAKAYYRSVSSDSDAFGLFVDEVSRIVQQTAAVDEARLEGPHSRRT